MVTLDPVRLLRRYWPLLAAAVFVGAVAGVGAHFAFMRYSPVYTAAVTFELSMPYENVLSTERIAQGNSEYERFLGTQVNLMTSDLVLRKALTYPEVEGSNWAKQHYQNGRLQPDVALRELTKDLSARPLPMSNLVRLSMSWREAPDVATIANSVSRAYLDDIRSIERSSKGDHLQALQARKREAAQEMQSLRNEKNRLMSENSMTTSRDLGSVTEDYKIEQINVALVEVTRSLQSIRSLKAQADSALSSAGTISYPEDLLEEVKRDPLIANMESDLASTKVERQVLQRLEYGPNHQTMQQIEKRILSQEQELEVHRERLLRKLYDAQLAGYTNQEQALESQEKKLLDDLKDLTKRREDVARILVQIADLDTRIQLLTDEDAKLTASIDNMEALASNTVFDRVRIVRQAVTPTEVSFPNLRVMLAMGVILVTGLVGGLIVLRELLDQRVRGPSDLSMINRLSVLGVIPDAATDPARPKAVETSFRDAPMGVMSEAFRQVRAPLIKRMDQAGHRSLLVIGGMPESGATTVAANLAQAAASSDERVLLIDANMRRPAVHKVFKTADKPGLSDVLAGQVKLADAVQSAGENLWVLTAGTPALRGLTERLASETMSRLLAEAGAQYERIFVDAPPAIVSGDGLNLANRCDATVLVVRALQEKRGLVARLRGMFGEARSEFLGVIVNAVRPSAGGYMRGNIQATHEYQKATAA